MAYTWGAGANDYMSINPVDGIIDPNSILLTCGWSYLTTSATNNRLWATSNAHYARQSVTATSLQVAANRSTTDCQATYDSVFVTNTWQFIAILVATSASNSGMRVWVGSMETAPVEYTASSFTAGSGTVSGATTLYIGNQGTSGGFAFDGDLADYVYIYSNGSYSDFFGMTPSQAQSTNAGVTILQRFVTPLWRGQYGRVIGFGRDRVAENDGLSFVAPLGLSGARLLGRAGSTVTQNPFPTISGPTFSARGNPRPIRTGDRYTVDSKVLSRARGRR